jgi:hypothetical protein
MSNCQCLPCKYPGLLLASHFIWIQTRLN